jgi:preprotein translocase subunit SecF
MGIYVLSGRQISLPVIAALLTIVGYSLNDTIVVFDRIRENLDSVLRKMKLIDLMNLSINQTLSRTLLTSLTTLFVVLCLVLFGGGVINDFAFTLLVGIVIGTYSSVFVASPVVLALRPTSKDREG